MSLKVIETRYKGYRFRSRLEARWAVFFDALGVRYEYELEGFDLGKAGWYLPDFYLPDADKWIEIKPAWPDTEDLNKVAAFIGTGYFADCRRCDGVAMVGRDWATSLVCSCGDRWKDPSPDGERVASAIVAAKSERFEYRRSDSQPAESKAAGR